MEIIQSELEKCAPGLKLQESEDQGRTKEGLKRR